MDTTEQLPYPDLKHQRSNDILAFVIRNEVATNEAIHRRVLHTPRIATATVQKIVRRLIKRDLLARWPLRGSQTYLRLGPAAIARWGYPQRLCRRLGPQKLEYQFGCLSLMTYHQPPLTRLLRQRLQKLIPTFLSSRDLMQWAYYLEDAGAVSKLATVRVEFRASAPAIVSKLNQQLHDYRRHPVINGLLDRSMLIVHVVTATPEQEESIIQSADQQGFPAELRVNHDPRLTAFL